MAGSQDSFYAVNGTSKEQLKVLNEISQYDIPDHQLLPDNGAKRLGADKDIGEAQVVSTLFGKAKVRIIHKQDKPIWLWPLATATVLGVVAVAIWWGKDSPQQVAPVQDVALPVAAPAAVPANAPALQAEPTTNSHAEPPPAQTQPQPPTPPAGNSPSSSMKGAQQPAPPSLQVSAPIAAKPMAEKPDLLPVKSKPEKTAPAAKPTMAKPPSTAANNDQPANPADMQPAAKSPAAVKSAPQPVATQPAASLSEGNPKPLPPAGGDQQPAPSHTQP